MNQPVDLIQLVKALPDRPRGRACCVLTHDFAGQKSWAAELARQTGSAHLDLLDHFARNPQRSRNIAQYSVDAFFQALASARQPDDNAALHIPDAALHETPVLIVSGLEFLKATWVAQPGAAEQFAGRTETWNHALCLLFVLQYDNTIATRPYRRFRQYRFVVEQQETLAL